MCTLTYLRLRNCAFPLLQLLLCSLTHSLGRSKNAAAADSAALLFPSHKNQVQYNQDSLMRTALSYLGHLQMTYGHRECNRGATLAVSFGAAQCDQLPKKHMSLNVV